MTVPLLMTCCLGVFWAKKINYKIGPCTIYIRFGLAQLLASPKTEDHFQGSHCQQLGTYASRHEEHSRGGVPVMCENSGKCQFMNVLLCKETFKGDRYYSYVGINYSLYGDILGA